jgi:hypothetical protein
MQVIVRLTCLFILLFAGIFLASQFHYCCDFASAPSPSHICPVCSTAASVVAAQSPAIAIVPLTNRLELTSLAISVSSAIPRATSPRAPPAL